MWTHVAFDNSTIEFFLSARCQTADVPPRVAKEKRSVFHERVDRAYLVLKFGARQDRVFGLGLTPAVRCEPDGNDVQRRPRLAHGFVSWADIIPALVAWYDTSRKNSTTRKLTTKILVEVIRKTKRFMGS